MERKSNGEHFVSFNPFLKWDLMCFVKVQLEAFPYLYAKMLVICIIALNILVLLRKKIYIPEPLKDKTHYIQSFYPRFRDWSFFRKLGSL